MKTAIKKMMLAILVSALASANALAFEDSLKVSDEKSFELLVSEVRQPTRITLTDPRNNELYSYTIDPDGTFTKQFNLELLPSGTYTLKIEDGLKVKEVVLNIQDDQLTVSPSDSGLFFKPVIREKGEMVYVSQFAPERAPLYVAIYNQKEELVHEEVLRGRLDLGKKYDFSKSMNGKYRFYLKSKGNSFNYLVYID